jgi:hypothetical protein
MCHCPTETDSDRVIVSVTVTLTQCVTFVRLTGCVRVSLRDVPGIMIATSDSRV